MPWGIDSWKMPRQDGYDSAVAEPSLMAAASQEKQLIDDYLVKEVIISELET